MLTAMAGGRSTYRTTVGSIARFCTETTAEAVPESASITGVSVRDFLKSIGNGVEAHAEKVAKKVETLDELLLIKRLQLKKMEVPCKQRKMIMRYTEKYRQNLWQPRVMETR